MARGRYIKPSFFLSEKVAALPPHGRLLFIALWQLADREGRLEDRPLRIRAETFPYEPEVDVDRLLEEIARLGMIVRYEVAGARYIQVRKFEKHQRVSPREAKSTIPPPPPPTTTPTPPPPGLPVENSHFSTDFSTDFSTGDGGSDSESRHRQGNAEASPSQCQDNAEASPSQCRGNAKAGLGGTQTVNCELCTVYGDTCSSIGYPVAVEVLVTESSLSAFVPKTDDERVSDSSEIGPTSPNAEPEMPSKPPDEPEIEPTDPPAIAKLEVVSAEKRAAAVKRREIEWRIDEVWAAHLAQFRGYFEDTTGKAPPGRPPTLTPEIRQDIRQALLTYDAELLGPESREQWVEESKARAAGVGIYLDPFLTGQSPDNDLRNGGKRFLEHWRPWRRQRGKGCPVERFAELYFEARLLAPRKPPPSDRRPLVAIRGGKQGVIDELVG